MLELFSNLLNEKNLFFFVHFTLWWTIDVVYLLRGSKNFRRINLAMHITRLVKNLIGTWCLVSGRNLNAASRLDTANSLNVFVSFLSLHEKKTIHPCPICTTNEFFWLVLCRPEPANSFCKGLTFIWRTVWKIFSTRFDVGIASLH